MENILFLDIDGVLNISSGPRGVADSTFFKSGEHMDYIIVKKFNILFQEKEDLKIVISSSWREDMDDLKYNLEKNGFEFWDRVIGRTSLEPLYRGQQILKYLEENSIKKFLVLDDCIGDICSEDFYFIEKENVLKINPRQGFSLEDLDFCLNYF